jgi:glyoxylase-like metal-dependent hydrolase (beta-lactamase superfamily II)
MDDIRLPSGVVDDWGVLTDGYAPWPLGGMDETGSVASTISFVRSGEHTIIHDPGLVRSRATVLDPLGDRGFAANEVTDVIISHHHPDHTLNIALFENAKTHDVWGIYQNDQWHSRMADGAEVAPGVTLVHTPGHTEQDISTLVRTRDGLVVFTHLWWTDSVPEEDPFAVNSDLLHSFRERILGLDPILIVPGHGAAFEPSSTNPR